VLSNLLTNAAKYTDPEGVIRVVARPTADSVIIHVIDNGIGIAPEALPRIFQMFSQVVSTQDRSDGGLGIGLALAKGLIELHGGRIESRAATRPGSEFTVHLPSELSVPRDMRSRMATLPWVHSLSAGFCWRTTIRTPRKASPCYCAWRVTKWS